MIAIKRVKKNISDLRIRTPEAKPRKLLGKKCKTQIEKQKKMVNKVGVWRGVPPQHGSEVLGALRD